MVLDLAVPTTKQDARRALAAAMISIGRASDPQAELELRQDVIETAIEVLGPDPSARRFLTACGIAAESVTPAAEPALLPEAAVQQLRTLLQTDLGVDQPALVAIEEVRGGDREGYDLTFTVAGESRRVFAIELKGTWVFAPGPIGVEDLETVTRAFRRHFETTIGMGLHLRGVPNGTVGTWRDAIVPIRTLWPDERDPYGVCDEQPLVFVMHNPMDDRRAFYCGYDPATNATEPYDTDTLERP